MHDEPALAGSADLEMARRIRAHDWSRTPLGPAEAWPPALRAAVDMILASPVGMIVLWGPELVQVYNDGFRVIMGAKHPAGLGLPNRASWPEVWDFNRPIYESVLAGQSLIFRDKHLVVERSGHPEHAWFDLTFSPLASDGEAPQGIIVSIVEQTDRMLSQNALKANEQRLATAVAASGGGVFEHHIPVDDELHLDGRWFAMLGLSGLPVRPEAFEDWYCALIHPSDRPARRETFAAFLSGERPRHELELRLRHANGDWVWVREFALPVECDDAGRVTHLCGMMLDITQRKAAERKVQHLARHDALTGLPNRLFFNERVEAAIGTGSGKVGLVLLDLDHFKDVNDTLGHHAGDALLLTVAERLRGAIRPADTAARIGGDEFAMVLTGLSSREDLEQFARRIARAVIGPARIESKALDLTASLGATLAPEDGRDLDELMRHTDLALYDAKRRGRDRICVFHDELARAAERRVRIERELRHAIRGDELLLHFQPQVDLTTGRVTTVEALVRWLRRGELILPGEFIGVAEASGAIRPLGGWVLSEACRQLAMWRAEGLDLAVAVNVSPAEANSEGFAAGVDAAATAAGIPSERLEFEITETLLIDPEAPPVRSFLAAARERGIGLAIDDFGVGYSSLGYLARLPITKVKIDRSFVSQIGDRRYDALVEAVVQLGQRLGHRVVAEGVERPEQLAFLASIGCDDAQGSLLAPPGDAGSLQDILREGIDIARRRRSAG